MSLSHEGHTVNRTLCNKNRGRQFHSLTRSPLHSTHRLTLHIEDIHTHAQVCRPLCHSNRYHLQGTSWSSTASYETATHSALQGVVINSFRRARGFRKATVQDQFGASVRIYNHCTRDAEYRSNHACRRHPCTHLMGLP